VGLARRSALLLILALAAAIRLVGWAQLEGGPLLQMQRWTESDMHFYDGWARQIAAGDWLTDARTRPWHSGHRAVAREAHALAGSAEPFDDAAGERTWDAWLGEKTFYQDPLYAYFLALVYRIFGVSTGAVVLVQSLLGLACVGLVFGLARSLFGETVALVAGGMAALFGPLPLYELALLRPVLITATGLAALLLFVRALERPERGRLLLAGLASGIAVLAQSAALLSFLAAGLVLGVSLRSRGLRLGRPFALVAVGFALALAPAVARNLAVGAPPLVLSATGGWTFLNHNAEDYEPWVGDTVTQHAGAILSRTGGRMLPTIVETIRTHASLAGWLRVLGGKLACFWHWDEMPNNLNYDYYRLQAPALGWLALPFSLVAPLAALGMLAAGWRSAPHALLALHVLSGLATLVFFYSISRLRLPIAVAMIPFAAHGAVAIVRAALARRYARLAAAALVVAPLTGLVLRPLPPSVERIRLADYGVPNEIALHLTRQRLAVADLAGAERILARQIALEPGDLAAADPSTGSTRLGPLSAELAGSFAPLHAALASVRVEQGRAGEAQHEERRAGILRALAGELERRKALRRAP
jgi:4-amino-4-deoxy-L-arabinose transferase-like glycosyltransferase